MAWDTLASDDILEKTAAALTANGIRSFIVENGEEAKQKVFALLPLGAEAMPMTSVTLDTLGISKEINESGKYVSIRSKVTTAKDEQEKRRFRSAPQYGLGSVHAVTEDGHVLIASQSGSQLPSYAYASEKVIWVVGGQKVVKNTEEGIKRIYEYVLPLEDARAQKAYGSGSNVNKLLIINAEKTEDRLTLILVKEKLGF